MFYLVREQRFALVQLLALFFAEQVLLGGLLELRVLTAGNVGVGCFDFGFCVGVGGHGLG